MKILYVFNQDLNPYVQVIQEGLAGLGQPVDSATEPFWKGAWSEYDVLHFQWPETLLDWRCPSELELLLLEERLAALKGTRPVVLTFHNRRSHHIRGENRERFERLYGLMEGAADGVIHLGAASLEAEADRFPNARMQRVIPIPVYERRNTFFLQRSAAEARRRLGLPRSGPLLLCFGNFRYPEEKRLVEGALERMPSPRPRVFAPKWFRPADFQLSPQHPCLGIRSLGAWVKNRRHGIDGRSWKYMDDEQVADCFTACDGVFLQRGHELNSGVLPMAYLFGKVVAGPDCGNIGFWLRESGNPCFAPGDAGAAARALGDLRRLDREGKGERNREYARAHWGEERVAKAHLEFYRELAGEHMRQR